MGVTFTTSVMQAQGKNATGISIPAEVKAGDQVEVILNLDLEPRTVEIPDDLRAALSSQEGAIEALKHWHSRSGKNLSGRWTMPKRKIPGIVESQES